jgi:PIN domain nuclease of toxin-antitoxin system
VIAVDASALLAYMFREAGHEQVARELDHSLLSTVNLSEVLGRFARDGHDPHMVLARIQTTSIEIIPFEPSDAVEVASLLLATRAIGLSLGDRACLALARSRGIPALTADQTWANLDVGVDVRVIR